MRARAREKEKFPSPSIRTLKMGCSMLGILGELLARRNMAFETSSRALKTQCVVSQSLHKPQKTRRNLLTREVFETSDCTKKHFFLLPQKSTQKTYYQMPPKRPHTEVAKAPAPKAASPSKRPRHASHHATCSDNSCEGCVVGEVDVQITSAENSELSGAELYRAALEERDGRGTKSVDTASSSKEPAVGDQGEESDEKRQVVTRLFEMALERFEKDIGINDEEPDARKKMGAGSSNSSAPVETRLLYASCLVDFGVYLLLPSHIERATAMFTSCLKDAAKVDPSIRASAHLGLAKSNLEYVLAKWTEEEGEDDVEDDGEGPTNDAQVEEDRKVVDGAKANVEKGLKLLKDSNERFAKESVAVARLFRDHAVLQRRRGEGRKCEHTPPFF